MKNIFVLILLGLTLSGCGDGGGGATPVVTQPTVVVQPQSVIQNDFGNATLGNSTFE